MRNALPWIVAGVLVIAVAVVFALLLRAEQNSYESDRVEWQQELARMKAETQAAQERADTSEARFDRALAIYKAVASQLLTPEQQDEKAQRALDGAGLDSVLNVLDRGTGPAKKRMASTARWVGGRLTE